MTISRDRYFESATFLKAVDVRDGQSFTIEKFEEVKTRIGLRPVLRFAGIEKPLGLNATNLDRMVEKFGNDETKWAGKKIRLRLVDVPNPQNGGKMQKGVRIE